MRRRDQPKVFVGPNVRCPQCGSIICIKVGSLLSEVGATGWTMALASLEHIAETLLMRREAVVGRHRKRDPKTKDWLRDDWGEFQMFKQTNYRMRCSRCSGYATTLYFTEFEAGRLGGPWCEHCLDCQSSEDLGDHVDDLPVYVVPVRTATKYLGLGLHLPETRIAGSDADVAEFNEDDLPPEPEPEDEADMF